MIIKSVSFRRNTQIYAQKMASNKLIKKLGFESREELLKYLSNVCRGKGIIYPSDNKLKELNLTKDQWKTLRSRAMKDERVEGDLDDTENIRNGKQLNEKKCEKIMDLIDDCSSVCDERRKKCKRKFEDLEKRCIDNDPL